MRAGLRGATPHYLPTQESEHGDSRPNDRHNAISLCDFQFEVWNHNCSVRRVTLGIDDKFVAMVGNVFAR